MEAKRKHLGSTGAQMGAKMGKTPLVSKFWELWVCARGV